MSKSFVNGKLVETSSLSVDVEDFGFMRSFAIFDLIRCYNGKLFRSEDHINRLMDGISKLDIPIPFSKEQLMAQGEKLVAMNNFEHSTLKYYITAGRPSEGSNFGSMKFAEPQVYVTELEYKPFSAEYPANEKHYKKGISLKTVEVERTLPTLKTTVYLPALYACRQHKNYDDILYVNRHNLVTESSKANIFFVKNGTLITTEHEILAGITRKVVLEIAQKMGIPYEIRDIEKSEIKDMDEAFITGSVVEMMPIQKIDDIFLKSAVKNSIYNEIFKSFRAKLAEL